MCTKKHKKSIKSEFQFFFALVLKIFDCKFVFLLLRSVSSFTVYLPTLLREKQREREGWRERERGGTGTACQLTLPLINTLIEFLLAWVLAKLFAQIETQSFCWASKYFLFVSTYLHPAIYFAHSFVFFVSLPFLCLALKLVYMRNRFASQERKLAARLIFS